MTIEQLAAEILKQTQERLRTAYPNSPQWEWEKVRVVPGPKYTKIDRGPEGNMSGMLMIENATGRIYGIKGYGRVHKGHYYGTLDETDQWNWADYYPRKAEQPKPTGRFYRVHVHDHNDQGRWLASVDFPRRPGDEQIGKIELLSKPGRYEVRVNAVTPGGSEYRLRGWLQGGPRADGEPLNPELFKRTAPLWNCVDHPGEGPHYTPGTGRCEWCGMTREQIAAEWDAREAGCCDECQGSE